MKKLALITISSLLVSTAAFADDQMALCSMLSSHQAMSAAYKPGVDVNGNPVAPADVAAQTMPGMPDILRVPVTIDMAKQLTVNWPQGTEMKADMGTIELHKDGRILFGGHDVKNETVTLCASTPKEQTPAPAAKSAAKSGKKAHQASAKRKKPAETPVAAEAPEMKEAVPPAAEMPSEQMAEPAEQDNAPWSPQAESPVPAAGEPEMPQERAAPPAISPPSAPGVPSAPWDEEQPKDSNDGAGQSQ